MTGQFWDTTEELNNLMSFTIRALQKNIRLLWLPVLLFALLGGCVAPPEPAPPTVIGEALTGPQPATTEVIVEPTVAPIAESQTEGTSVVAEATTVPLAERRRVSASLCKSSFGKAREVVETELFKGAERQAAIMLYGEEIGAASLVRNFALVEDEIWTRLLGRIWLVGSPIYTTGTNLGDICISAEFFITEEDWRTYSAKQIGLKEMCKLASEADEQGVDVQIFTREAALIEALYAFEGRLRDVSHDQLLRLPKEVRFENEGPKLVRNVAYYCVTGLTAFVLPDEVRVLIEQFDESAPIATATPTATVTPTATPTAWPTVTPSASPIPPVDTAKPTFTPRPVTPHPTNTPTPSVLTPPTLIEPKSNQRFVTDSSTIPFRWQGGSVCSNGVECILSLDRMQGDTVTKWKIVQVKVEGTGYDLDIKALEPGDYQWTVVVRRGNEEKIPTPISFHVAGSGGGDNSPVPTPTIQP